MTCSFIGVMSCPHVGQLWLTTAETDASAIGASSDVWLCDSGACSTAMPVLADEFLEVENAVDGVS